MDKLETAADAVKKFSEIQFTTMLLFALLFGGFIVIAFVLIRYSNAQSSAAKSNSEILGKQLELQSKQLDAFNGLASQVGNLNGTIALQNTDLAKYNKDIQHNLSIVTGALDKALKNTMTTVTALGRVEKNGDKMVEELGAARKEVKEVAATTTDTKSGVHQLSEIMQAGLADVTAQLTSIAGAVKDLPQIREQLNAATERIEQLAHDLQRLDVPRTATNPPDAPPVSNEGD
jgi:chromosome segregation ATPase